MARFGFAPRDDRSSQKSSGKRPSYEVLKSWDTSHPFPAQVERKLCEEVAALAASYDFADCGAAKDLGSDRCGLRARETSTYVGGANGEALDFMTVLVERDAASKTAREAPGVGELPGAAVKCALVMGDENYDEVPPGGLDPNAPPKAFDETPLGGATSHIFLHRCLKAVSSDESMDRVRKAPLKFQQTVEELLHLTRPFSFY